jgi:outer membrane receptor protein involved in Fe transport
MPKLIVVWERWTSTYSDTLGEFFSPSDRMLGGKLSLRTELNEFANVYAAVARGYKLGGFNLGTGIQGVERLNDLIYDPEYLWNYEIGTSVLSPNSNLLIEAVVFWSDRENQQVLISKQLDPNNPTTFQYLTQNAASGKNYGTELNLRAKLTDEISLFAALGLLKTEIRHHQSRPELEGRRQAHAPAKSYSFGIRWQASDQFHLSMDLSGKSDFYYSDSHTEKSKPYTLINFSLGYRHKDWVYEFWVRNLFDRYYSVRGFYFGNEPPNFPSTLYQRQGDPRHLGILVRYEF